MSVNYATNKQALQALLVIPQDNIDQNFENMIPRGIEYAEQRIYRELDFLTTNSAATATLASGDRNIAMPGAIIILDDINVVTPSSQTNPDLGNRVPLERVSLDFLNAVWGNGATTGIPKVYALLTDTAVKLGPVPDAAYTAEFIGNIRPTPMSPTNTTTWLGTNLPDLFLAAQMIWWCGYQRNFGAQADDPQSAQSWEKTYQDLKIGSLVEEWRRKAQAPGWTPYSPPQLANAPRERATQ